ncbi:MAG TPA: hypothetical protein VGI60_14950 [Chthoniobacterales bacterium]
MPSRIVSPDFFRYLSAAQNGCLAAISELALAARAPDKKLHHCVLMGYSFDDPVLGNTISYSILDASSMGARNWSPWDMAVAFNSADDSIGTRQLMSELDTFISTSRYGMLMSAGQVIPVRWRPSLSLDPGANTRRERTENLGKGIRNPYTG